MAAAVAWTSVAISLPHIMYGYVWLNASKFMSLCKSASLGDPVDAFATAAVIGKVIQFAAAVAWFLQTGATIDPSLAQVVVGVALLAVGQWLNMAAMKAIGKRGIYYGCKLGYTIPWCTSFPFGTVPHPQYVGSCLSVLGAAVLVWSSTTLSSGLPVLVAVWLASYFVSGYIEQANWEPTKSS